MNTLNQIDALLHAQFPTVMMPKFGALSVMEKAGHRFIMAKNGVWTQIKRSWLNVFLLIMPAARVPLPYGEVDASLTITPIPNQLFREFESFAKENYPNECAARILIKASTQEFRLEKMIPTSVSTDRVSYDIPLLPNDEELIVDLHSHGTYPPFFSEEDDLDDATEVKIAAVIGFPSGIEANELWTFRLCANGIFQPLAAWSNLSDIIFKVEGT